MELTSYLLGKKAGGGSGSNLQTKSLTVTENGSTTITPDENYDGMSKVNLTTNVQPNLESKSITITENTTTTITPTTGKDGLSSVEVVTNVSGGGLEEKDVTFYDYDGSIVYSYTKAQFLALSAPPDNPNHTSEGLESLGWNWPFDKAQEYVQKYGVLNVGQNYVTLDGATKIYITLDDPQKLSPYLGIGAGCNVTIDWGDGSTSNLSKTSVSTLAKIQHTYSTTGNYVISIKRQILQAGRYTLLGGTLNNTSYSLILNNNGNVDIKYLSCIKKIEMGSNCYVTDRGLASLHDCKSITINAFGFDGQYILQYSNKMGALILPPNSAYLLNLGLSRYAGYGQNVIVGYGIVSIGQQALAEIANTKITLPDTVTTIESTGVQGYNLTKIIYGMPTAGWQNMMGNSKAELIETAETVTTLPYNSFASSDYVKKIIINGDITSIGNQAFSGLNNLRKIYFLNCTSVPVASTANFVYNMPTEYIIVVPDSLYNDWISAQYWSNIASHIIRESDDV